MSLFPPTKKKETPALESVVMHWLLLLGGDFFGWLSLIFGAMNSVGNT